jgi:hypothetical protein
MKKIFCFSFLLITLIISCEDEKNFQTSELIDYREQYIGQWEFIKYWSISHPFEPSSGEVIWNGEVYYGDSDSTLMIPNGPILEGSEQYCSCYEFQVNVFGEINDDSFDAADFNYHFDGYITPDSIYYSAAGGSPFSSNSRTIYGKKIE